MGKMIWTGALALAFLGAAGAASGQTLRFGAFTPSETDEGDAVQISVPIEYVAGGTGIIAISADIVIPPEFVFVPPSPALPARCVIDQPDPGRLRLSATENDEAELASIAQFCSGRLTFSVANSVAAGSYNFSVCSAGNGSCQDPVARDIANTAFDLNVEFAPNFVVNAGPTPPTIADGVYTDAGASGTEGVVTQVGTIAFAITSPAAGGGSGSIVCTDAAGGPNFSFSPSGSIPVVGGTSSPVNVAVSCPLSPFGGGDVSGDVTCNIVDSANPTAPGRAQTINVSCPEGAEATGPILTPPAVTDINVGTGIVGGPGSGSIVFTAAGGDPGQVTALNCSVDSGPVTVTPLTQNVMTGASSASVTVSVPLTVAPQPDVGQVTCNGVSFSISAPAGLTGPPLTIPASSLWSQLALIALFLGLGGLIVLRRNG